MNVGKLVNNLQAMLGMDSGTIRILSGFGYGWETIPFSFSNKKIKTDETPYKIEPDQLYNVLNEAKAPAHLILKEIASKQEFYVFNSTLRAFLGKDEMFYPYNLVCDECKFDSLKSATMAVTKYGRSTQCTFRIYERMTAEYFNAHEITAEMIIQSSDTVEVHDFGSEHPVFRWLSIVNGLLEENYIPNYEKIQLLTDTRFLQIKDLDNRGCWSSISQEDIDGLVLFLKSIRVQPYGGKSYTVEEYIHGVDE